MILVTNISPFIEQYRDRQRFHSALGYRPSKEFGLAAEPGVASTGATLSYLGHKSMFGADVNSFEIGETAETAIPPRLVSTRISLCFTNGEPFWRRSGCLSGKFPRCKVCQLHLS